MNEKTYSLLLPRTKIMEQAGLSIPWTSSYFCALHCGDNDKSLIQLMCISKQEQFKYSHTDGAPG